MGPESNSVSLQAVLLSMQSLRYTPGGVAMIDAVLSHRSTQREGGHPRQVELDMSARFADRAAEQLSRTPLGSVLRVQGFLAPRRRGSKSVLLHVTEFQQDPTPASLSGSV
ncbi:MAG: primosomal replication protein N [Betaproteobacteria bacterium]|nr:primosomal replication protein N [Betaproteobacteria bacterium]